MIGNEATVLTLVQTLQDVFVTLRTAEKRKRRNSCFLMHHSKVGFTKLEAISGLWGEALQLWGVVCVSTFH